MKSSSKALKSLSPFARPASERSFALPNVSPSSKLFFRALSSLRLLQSGPEVGAARRSLAGRPGRRDEGLPGPAAEVPVGQALADVGVQRPAMAGGAPVPQGQVVDPQVVGVRSPPAGEQPLPGELAEARLGQVRQLQRAAPPL